MLQLRDRPYGRPVLGPASTGFLLLSQTELLRVPPDAQQHRDITVEFHEHLPTVVAVQVDDEPLWLVAFERVKPQRSRARIGAKIQNRPIYGRLSVGIQAPIVSIEATRREHARDAHRDLSPQKRDQIIRPRERLGRGARSRPVMNRDGDDQCVDRLV